VEEEKQIEIIEEVKQEVVEEIKETKPKPLGIDVWDGLGGEDKF
jgi:hypothetical protein